MRSMHALTSFGSRLHDLRGSPSRTVEPCYSLDTFHVLVHLLDDVTNAQQHY